MSLLEDAIKAERVAKVDEVSEEQMEMAIAWLEEKVSTGACARALGKKPTIVLQVLGRFLKAAYREGKIKTSKTRS